MSKGRRERAVILAWIMALAFVSSEAFAQTTATPMGTVDVGDSPIALAVSSDNRRAVVVNLYPEPAGGTVQTNIKIVDYVSLTKTKQFRVGQAKRLISLSLTNDGRYALFVNEDDDNIYAQDLAATSPSIALRVGSRPSNVIVASPTLAVVTNGTSGDLSFIKLNLGNPDPAQKLTMLATTRIGSDPRAIAVHPSLPYAYGIRPLPSGVKIIGSGAAITIVDGEQMARDGNGNAFVVPQGANNVRIAGFTVRNALHSGVLVALANNVLIDRNFFTSNARFGFGAFGSNGLVVKENVAVANEE